MKKTMLSILLAVQLAASLATTGFAATDQVTYPIGSISPVGYLLDDDTNRVDFQDSADGATRVRYGETVYFPLLNNGAAAGATEEQLLARTARLSLDLEQNDAYLDSLKNDFDTAERNLENALNAAILSRELLVSDLEGLIDAIDAETIDAGSREEEIASLREELAAQKRFLDSAIELDSAAGAALAEILPEIELAGQELETLRALVPPVRERARLEERREELQLAMQDSGHLLEEAWDDLNIAVQSSAVLSEKSGSDWTTGDLRAVRRELADRIDGLEEEISAIRGALLPGSLTEKNRDQVYEPYLRARDKYQLSLAQNTLDSGVVDYLDDPDPDLEGYSDHDEVPAYGERIKELLLVYQGVGEYSGESRIDARNLAQALGKLGLESDEPQESGSLYARLNYNRRELGLVDDAIELSRSRDNRTSAVKALAEEDAKLAKELNARAGEIAALAARSPSLSLDPEALTPDELGGADDGWEDDSMIGNQQDRLFDLLEEQSDLKKEKDAAAEAAGEEQAAYDELDRRLTALTDPNAPSASTRATRLRQNYPFLLFSQTFKEADGIEALDSEAVREELDGLLGLFLKEGLENRGPESDRALLEKMRAYESYVAAKGAYTRQLPGSNELLRSATAAALAYEQAAPGSEKYPYVYENKAVDGVKLKSKWEEGKKYVDEISLVKKRYQYDSGYTGAIPSQYIYFIALKTKDRDTTSTGTVDLFGTISMKKSRRSDSLNQFDYDDMELEVNLELGFNHPEDANLIPIEPAAFYPDEDFDEDDEETFDFEADGDSYYIANTNSQKKLVLGMNTDYDEEIGGLYASQTDNLYFWNGNGGAFQRSGYLYLAADEDSFLYKVGDNGALVPVAAEYDDYEGCFVIRTRTLGRFVVSDVELELIDPLEDDEEEQVVAIITPDDADETAAPPAAPSRPSPGWSQGSRSDEEEAPVSSSQEPFAPESSGPEISSAPEELPTAAETGDISVPLLIGVSVAGALLLTLAVFLIIGAKSGKFRRQ